MSESGIVAQGGTPAPGFTTDNEKVEGGAVLDGEGALVRTVGRRREDHQSTLISIHALPPTSPSRSSTMIVLPLIQRRRTVQSYAGVERDIL